MNPNVLSAPEIERYLDELRTASHQFMDRVIEFRSSSHGLFCCTVTGVLLAIYFIGRSIPGVLLVYCFGKCFPFLFSFGDIGVCASLSLHPK